MEVKDKYPDCLVLFRMGDFYETFYEDAKTVSKVLDIVLTSRGKGEKKAPLAGIPYHAIDSYLGKLVKSGHKVCIVEQLEDPKKAKGIVKRGVVRVITPGTVIEDNILVKGSNNFIMAVNKENSQYGVSLADISTGEFLVTTVNDKSKFFSEVEKFRPSEIIMPMSLESGEMYGYLKDKGYYVNTFDDRFFWTDKSVDVLKKHFDVFNLEGFGIAGDEVAVSVCGGLMSYLKETQMNSLSHITKINKYNVEGYMIIDQATQRNLEILRNIRDGSSRGSLFDVIDKTVTSVGSRMLKQWVIRPLIDVEGINLRLDSVNEIVEDAILREEIKEILSKFSDIERIISKVVYKTVNPKDLIALKQSLSIIPRVKEMLSGCKSKILCDISSAKDLSFLVDMIIECIKDEPSISVREGGIIKKGYNSELDELRKIAFSGKQWITEFEENEKKRTGIKSLKVKYNKIFGYFIEVTKSNLKNVPEDYIRKQTQANSERFITQELKEKENLVLSAQDKINSMEYDIFMELVSKIDGHVTDLQDISKKIGILDCILSFSIVSVENRYVRPLVNQTSVIEIEAGRHAVIETIETNFVDNDCVIGNHEQMKIITGPNMAGKSTYLRQNAIIVLLSQIGCFVPAKSANIGVVDRIFTRVGAYDDLSMGQSTFMVEMNETANILNNATERSFIILDEIGRGTSTYDGFSLAWAIAEHICLDIGAKTLFATHYHQLNKMAEDFPMISNYHIAVNETDDDIVLLRKIIPGGTDKSYGVHVAKIAGLPKSVISRAKVLMKTLEKEDKIMKKLEHEVVSQKELSTEEDNEDFRREVHITETITKKRKEDDEHEQKKLFDVVKDS